MRRLPGVLCAVLLLVGCGGGESPQGADELTGSLTVFAAASLTDALTAAEPAIERAHEGLSVTSNFAGSQVLVQQIIEGAPADIVATADTKRMDKLVDAGLVEEPRTLARNALAIAVAPGNPKRIGGLADLARADIAVVLADPSVPVGAYAAASLNDAGVTVRPRSLELDVKAALAKVTSGEADAAIVYVTDVLVAKGRAATVAIPDEDNQFVVYPIAVVRASGQKAAARALLRALTEGPGQAALRAHGFRV